MGEGVREREIDAVGLSGRARDREVERYVVTCADGVVRCRGGRHLGEVDNDGNECGRVRDARVNDREREQCNDSNSDRRNDAAFARSPPCNKHDEYSPQ